MATDQKLNKQLNYVWRENSKHTAGFWSFHIVFWFDPQRRRNRSYPAALNALSFTYYEGEFVPRNMTLAYAYLKIFFQEAGIAENDAARATIERILAGLSAVEIEEANEFISDWKTQPTPLTMKADEGTQAALKHIGNAQ